MIGKANRRTMLKLLMAAGVAGTTGVGGAGEAAAMVAVPALGGLHNGAEDRDFWVENLRRVSEPLLTAMKDRRLKELMPVERKGGVTLESRQVCTYLEAVGRLLSGIAPWLEHGLRDGGEGELRGRFAEYARAGIASGCDASSSDYLNFGGDEQTLVDTAFLGLGILRAPTELWEKLSPRVKQNVVKCMKATRSLKPGNNNWVLFSAMVETSLRFMGEEWEKERVTSAIDKLDSWYKGDGVYGDGPEFHWDYYNSIVMQPFLLEIFDREAGGDPAWKALQPTIERRALRYAAILELMISPEGTYPAIGRSLAYRCGVFQLLAEMSRREHLPEGVSAALVRSALTAVMRRQLGAPGTFDKNGWLTIGFCGHQPGVGEAYISTGSLYLCSEIFLPLGLGASSAFWLEPGADWSSRKQWSGVNFVSEHSLQGK
jgi:hypothetical protein